MLITVLFLILNKEFLLLKLNKLVAINKFRIVANIGEEDTCPKIEQIPEKIDQPYRKYICQTKFNEDF